jgi:hypothetical protein
MPSALREKIETVNTRLEVLIADTRRALAGEREFGEQQVKALSERIEEMAPVMQRARELRSLHPELAGELDLYTTHLRELQTVLEHVRVMLLATRARLESGRSHVDAVTKWAAAVRQTQ